MSTVHILVAAFALTGATGWYLGYLFAVETRQQ